MSTNPRIPPIERATGREWSDWMAFMDRISAKELDHQAIAVKVHEELEGNIDNPGWWAQGVTVAYEQEIGRRLPGQRSDGTFEASVSKATHLKMQELMDAWAAFASADSEVQASISGTPRISGTKKRITWRTKAADGSSIIVTSEPKNNDTASLVVQLMGLETPERKDEAREVWASILGRFVKSI